MRSAAAILVALVVTACDKGAETFDGCVARFSTIAQRLPSSASPVRPVYTFDLAAMDGERLDDLTTEGLAGRGPPRVVIANSATSDAVARFERSLPGPTGMLFSAPSFSLFRVAGELQPSSGAAIEAGCKLLPGARLRSVGVTGK
jgi:hypothetical protein